MDQYPFRLRLLRVSNGITNRELRQLKYMCKAHIADGVLHKIDRPEKLFDELQTRTLLSPENTELLENLLSEIHRLDLKEELLGEPLPRGFEEVKELSKHSQEFREQGKDNASLPQRSRKEEENEAKFIQRLNEVEEQRDNLQQKLKSVEETLANCKVEKEQLRRQLKKESAEARVKQQEIASLKKKLRDKVQDIVERDKALSSTNEKISKYEGQLKERDWVISRDELQITGKSLGEGGWGRVLEGKYCGCAVAIKQLHRKTLTSQEHNLFEREMDIASRIRHPCLLQFIGATQDDKSPLLVTELMEMNLRELLGKRELSETEITVISLDVARALNYLHQRKPTPIVHRDISSANVLLWRRGDHWRAKVSDYGTARFVQGIMTAAVGNINYSAPEAGGRLDQTVKLDCYSFGILLCEINVRQLPDAEKRDEQVKLVKNRKFQGLILWCLEEDSDDRPDMLEVIEKLEH